jgi:hypothetical protein
MEGGIHIDRNGGEGQKKKRGVGGGGGKDREKREGDVEGGYI